MHEVQTRVYDNTPKINSARGRKAIQNYWDKVAEIDGDTGSGLYSNIYWEDESRPYDSYQEALNYLENRSVSYDYDQRAVRFYTEPKTKKYADLKERYAKVKDELEHLKKAVYYTSMTVKSKLITCKCCGSKLAVSFLNSNNCPLCGMDLRPETELLRIKRLTAKEKELKTKISDEKKKNKNGLRWLVKVEYHT